MDHCNNTPMLVATGFDFQPLPDGNVLIEFQTDDGTTINKQIATADVVRRMPLVAALLDVAMRMGPEAAATIMDQLNDKHLPERTRP